MNKIRDYIYTIPSRFNLESIREQTLSINSILKYLFITIIAFQLINIGFKLLFDKTFNDDLIVSSQSYEEVTTPFIDLKVDSFKPNKFIYNNTNLDQEVPPTSLPLRLYGIRYTDLGIADAAILGFDQNNQIIYTVNDSIDADTTLEKIMKDKVVISRDGIRESVSFNDTTLISVIPSYTQETTTILKTKTLDSFAQNVVAFEPYFSNGIIKGFKIFPGQDEQAFNESGLQSGDLLLAINGISVNSPIVSVEMSNFSNQIDLDILRGKNSLSLTLDLD